MFSGLEERRRKDGDDQRVGDQKAEQSVSAQKLPDGTTAPARALRNSCERRLAHVRLPFSTWIATAVMMMSALDDPLIEGRHVQEVQNVVEQRNQIDAEQRAERSAPSARKRRAADDHRRDRREIESLAAPRVAAPHAADEIDAGQARRRPLTWRKRASWCARPRRRAVARRAGRRRRHRSHCPSASDAGRRPTTANRASIARPPYERPKDPPIGESLEIVGDLADRRQRVEQRAALKDRRHAERDDERMHPR